MEGQTDSPTEPRRPLRTRDRPIVGALAGWLLRHGVRPNAISVASVVVATVGAVALVLTPRGGEAGQAALLVVAAAATQLRLLANMLDGMVAIEGGRKSATGELFNEIPDRVADLVLLVAAGYATTWLSWGDALGWAAAVGALSTAYVRLLGGALGATQHFCGPMAKPHRMAALTAACLLSLAEVPFGYSGRVLTVALAVIAVGSVVTSARRTRLVALELIAR